MVRVRLEPYTTEAGHLAMEASVAAGDLVIRAKAVSGPTANVVVAVPPVELRPEVARKLGRLLMTAAYVAEYEHLPPWASAEGEEIVQR